MSDNPTHNEQRLAILRAYCLGLDNPKSNTSNLIAARSLFETVTPVEVMFLVDDVIHDFGDMDRIKPVVTRMLHSFYQGLSDKKCEEAQHVPLFLRMFERNKEINELIEQMKSPISRMRDDEEDTEETLNSIRSLVERLAELVPHYTQKEYLLFPFVEKHITQSSCVQLMWSIHDDIRSTLSQLITLLSSPSCDIGKLHVAIGKLFFDVKSMIFREENILIPALFTLIPLHHFKELEEDQYDDTQVEIREEMSEKTIDLVTGNPTVKQLLHIYNNLPVDITLVDKDDKVVFFNTPKHRIFPRSSAVIGRTVQNCHPPKSVHIVQQIP